MRIAHIPFWNIGNGSKQRYRSKFYNLDVILSVGYRVNSKNATQFRQWANRVLKEYLIKGYAINQRVKAAQLEDLKGTIRLLSCFIISLHLPESLGIITFAIQKKSDIC
jgi:hypothetical protein